MGQISTHQISATDRVIAPVYPHPKKRPPAPPRQPHYAVAQNKVLPFEFPQKALRPLSADLAHQYPGYKSSHVTDISKKKHSNGSQETHRASVEMGVTESKDLTKDSPDNAGYISTDICTELNGVTPNGYKHLNFYPSYMNLRNLKDHRRWSNDRQENMYPGNSTCDERVVNDGFNQTGARSCLVDNGQIINLPKKSSCAMDYSFAVTYAQLAKHRRHQNLLKTREKEAGCLCGDNVELGLNVDKGNEVSDGKVKYRAPPPPMRNGVEPPVDYEESDESEVCETPLLEGGQTGASTVDKPTKEPDKQHLGNDGVCDVNARGMMVTRIDVLKQAENCDGFTIVDNNGRVVSTEPISPIWDKTRRLSSLLQHDIVNAAIVRKAKLKRKAQRIPPPKTTEELCQSELAKICEEREKRASIAQGKMNENVIVDVNITDNSSADTVRVIAMDPGSSEQVEVKIAGSDSEKVGLSDVSFEKVETPIESNHAKSFDIITLDDVEKVSGTVSEKGDLETSLKDTEATESEKVQITSVEVKKISDVDESDSFEIGSSFEVTKNSDSGIQTSIFSRDWTPEDDLEESEDDQRSVLTSRKDATLEGFKKSVLPSQGMGNTVNLKAPESDKKNQFTSLLKFNKPLRGDAAQEGVGSKGEVIANGKNDYKENHAKDDVAVTKLTNGHVTKVETSEKISNSTNGISDDSEVKVKQKLHRSEGKHAKVAKKSRKRGEKKSNGTKDSVKSNGSHKSFPKKNGEGKGERLAKESEKSTGTDPSVSDSQVYDQEGEVSSEENAKTKAKRMKKMRKFGYLSTAKMIEKKRLQLYLQDQMAQQERKIEAERRKQRDLEKQMKHLDSHDTYTDEDDDDNVEEVDYKSKRGNTSRPAMALQYVPPLAYTVPTVIPGQLSTNALSANNHIPQSFIPQNLSGWYGNTSGLTPPAAFGLALPYGGMNGALQMPSQPVPYDLMQYVRMLERSQQMLSWSQPAFPPSNYSTNEPQRPAMQGWFNNGQNNDNARRENGDAAKSNRNTESTAAVPDTSGQNRNQSHNSQENNRSNHVSIDDALLSAMMNDYKQKHNSRDQGKTGREERANPLYDSSDDEPVARDCPDDTEATSKVSQKLHSRNTAIDGPIGYKPVNFSPNGDHQDEPDQSRQSDESISPLR